MKSKTLLLASVTAVLAGVCDAGFLDGLKTVGKGLGDIAGGIADGAVNITTSAVQNVSSFSGALTNAPIRSVSTIASQSTNNQDCITMRKQSESVSDGTIGIQPQDSSSTKKEGPHSAEQVKTDNRPIDAKHLRRYVEKDVKPRLSAFKLALERYEKSYNGTHWHDSFFCERDPNEFTDVLIPVLFEKGVPVCFGDDSYYSLQGKDSDLKDNLRKEYARPWNATYLGKQQYADLYTCSFSGDTDVRCDSMHDPWTGKELHREQINKKSMGAWKAKMSKWLAAEELKMRDLMLLDGEGIKLFAKEHGDTAYKPFAAFKDIQLGDSVEDVYAKLCVMFPNFRWGKPYSEEGTGAVIGDYLRGKTFKAYLQHHLLTLKFGAFKEVQGSALVSVRIQFFDESPTEEMILAKYEKIPGAKVKKVKMETSRTWRDDDAGRFCKSFVERVAEEADKLSDAQAAARLRADVEAVKSQFSTAEYREEPVVVVNGVEISFRCKKGTDKVVEVNIIDKIVSDVMKRKLAEVKQKRMELTAKMKEANKKSAIKSAVDF